MSYFIFFKNSENINGVIYKIAENQSDLNLLNIRKEDYKIIQDSVVDFDSLKLNKKSPDKYIQETINYVDLNFSFPKIDFLTSYINSLKISINQFLEVNSSHPSFSTWKNYYNQLNNLELKNITFPLNMSLEEYFKSINLPYYNILQLP
jgi:hypothetical protein